VAMSEQPPRDGNGTDHRFGQLRTELTELLREIPGGYRSLSARLGDCAIRITWGDPVPAVPTRSLSDGSTTGMEQSPDGGASEGQRGDDAAPAVTAPMVGIVYWAPEPGARPYVSVGERVEAGQTVAIIEAMKLMNQIEAPWPGTVTELLVDNAERVEFDQALVRIKPDGA
jgi:acetyl-CoA carboxylase biotin carboxyl carrier protein